MTGSDNNRRFLRRPIGVTFCINDVGAPTEAELDFDAADISVGGAFLRSDYLLEVGEVIEVSFALPGRASPIRAHARVVWATAKPKVPGEAGMGLAFVGLSDDERRAIESFVRGGGHSPAQVG